MIKEQQEIAIDNKNYKVFDKKIYTAVNDELRKYIKENNIDEIYLCGFNTDACIQTTAIDFFEQGYNFYVLKDYCMIYIGQKLHNAIIENLKRLIGVHSII